MPRGVPEGEIEKSPHERWDPARKKKTSVGPPYGLIDRALVTVHLTGKSNKKHPDGGYVVPTDRTRGPPVEKKRERHNRTNLSHRFKAGQNSSRSGYGPH